MFDGLRLGTDFKIAPVSEEFADATISFNAHSEGVPVIVCDNTVLSLSIPDQLGKDTLINVKQSYIRQLETSELPDIKISSDFLSRFNPNFPEGIFEGKDYYSSIIDIHSSGAILFSTTVLHKNDDGITEILDAGYFIQVGYLSEPVAIPEEAVLGFTEDPLEIILVCQNENNTSKLLKYSTESNSFKNIVFSDEVVDFYGGELKGFYLCGIADTVLDGNVIPNLADFKLGKMRRIKLVETPIGLSTEGVLVGYSMEDKKVVSRYLRGVNGRYGPISSTDENTSALVSNVQTLDSCGLKNKFHLVTGSIASTEIEHDPLSGQQVIATHNFGAIWLASDTELSESINLVPVIIEDRIPGYCGNRIIKTSYPASDMRMVATTNDGKDLLLIPNY
jgi:hypothetical protein